MSVDKDALEGDLPRVLVVDDSRVTVRVLADVLGDQCKIMAATNYQQAMQAVRSEVPPELILLDVMLPDVDGFEICRRLKADSETCHIPIIFITAKDGEADEAWGLTLGAVDYISKPIVPAFVRARVLAQISRLRKE